MKLLEERIKKDGKALGKTVLKVPGDGRSERCAYLIIFRLCGI